MRIEDGRRNSRKKCLSHPLNEFHLVAKWAWRPCGSQLPASRFCDLPCRGLARQAWAAELIYDYDCEQPRNQTESQDALGRVQNLAIKGRDEGLLPTMFHQDSRHFRKAWVQPVLASGGHCGVSVLHSVTMETRCRITYLRQCRFRRFQRSAHSATASIAEDCTRPESTRISRRGAPTSTRCTPMVRRSQGPKFSPPLRAGVYLLGKQL